MRRLYEQAWEDIRKLRATCDYLDEECTPILAFGRWRTARIVTAGLNPSTYEFRDPARSTTKEEKAPLIGDHQRFIHWGNGLLTQARLDEAFRRSEGYFELRNQYSKWFDKYAEFLNALNAPFIRGEACQTDYVSPFATRVRISRCRAAAALLEDAGFRYWLAVVELCPRVEMIFGHGRGWRRVEEHLRVRIVDIPTEFDEKGRRGRHISFAKAELPKSRRSVLHLLVASKFQRHAAVFLEAGRTATVGADDQDSRTEECASFKPCKWGEIEPRLETIALSRRLWTSRRG